MAVGAWAGLGRALAWLGAISVVRLPRTTRCGSLDEYREFLASSDHRDASMRAFEEGLLGREMFTVPGFCVVCGREVAFRVDHDHCWTGEDGRRVPNWRERMECPDCLLNSRMRASVGFLLAASEPRDRVYLTEAVTPLFRAMMGQRQALIGSEFLRDGTGRGEVNPAGVRHEDVTALSFADASLDLIGSFDVLEHVPDYRRALGEFARCLRRGGRLLLTVPFSLGAAHTVTRAVVTASGAVEHRLPPVYHGDPMSPDGALCFHEHGWDLLDAMRVAGFGRVEVVLFWDAGLGYLGGYQIVIEAEKSRAKELPSRSSSGHCNGPFRSHEPMASRPAKAGMAEHDGAVGDVGAGGGSARIEVGLSG